MSAYLEGRLVRLLNFVCFQAGWFACILGAGRGWPWIGVVAVAVSLGIQFRWWPQPTRMGWFLLTVGFAGAALDSTLGYLGLFLFHESSLPNWVCPPWLLALWFNFASTLPVSLRWLSGRAAEAAVLGAVFGPISYYAGTKLGALRLLADTTTSLAVLAILWGLLLPGLMRLTERMTPSVPET